MLAKVSDDTSRLSFTVCGTADGKTSILLILAASLKQEKAKVLVTVPDSMHQAICND